ncbi:HDOD domain-containing protein [Chitinivorax sp. PXF-14]|uniref:HDOD domain-containing protein n=1 Tax=Chitinivorax sp. PXF-14 TaxID=3230488 RepID=UPI003466116D
MSIDVSVRTPDAWLARWHTRPMPVLAGSVARIAALAEDLDRISPSQLAKVAATDPFLCAHLLRFVNNRSRSSTASDVLSLEAAVALMGTRRFIEQFGHLPTVEARYAPGSPGLAVVTQLVARARLAAELAFDCSAARLDVKPEEVEVSALLHNLAACLLALHEPASHAEWLPWFLPRLDDGEHQHKRLGCTLAELQSALLQRWHMPGLIGELLDPGQVGNPRASTLQAVCRLTSMLETGWHHAELPDALQQLAGFLRIEPEAVLARAERVALALARVWPYPTTPTAASWLPMLPGAWARPAAPVAEPPAPRQPSQQIYTEVVARIRAHLDGTLTFNEMMGLVIRGMHEGIGLDRIVFALMADGQRRLKARYLIGAAATEPLAHFGFALDTPHLLTRLMQKTAGVWLTEHNRAQIEPMLPPGMRACIGDGDFFSMSLFVNDKPVGLLYADRRPGSNRLDEVSYQAFKQLALLAAQGLAHLAGKTPLP